MKIFGYFLVVFISSAGFAQQQQKPASLRGQVTSITGEPLRKADVTLRATGQTPTVVMTTTDAAGSFAFQNVVPSKYVISAQRNGFVRQESLRRSGAAPAMQGITLAPGQDVTGIVIKLTPHSVITGKVTDEDGDAMFGANVNILEERYFRGRRTLTPRANGQVNDLGDYRIAGLQPGKYFLVVQPRGEFGPSPKAVRAAGQETDTNFVPIYYPGAVDQSQATPIQLQPGQEARGIDVQMRRMATVHIRGRVVDEGGNAVANTRVMILNGEHPGGAMGRNMGIVQKDGAFDIAGVPPGTHTLVANRMTRDRGRSAAMMNIQVGSRDLDGITLRMSAPAQITGVVKAAENPDLKSVRVTLDPMENVAYDMQSSRNMGEGNTFTVPDVNPGRYRVDIFGAPQGFYLKSVLVGGQDVKDSGLNVTGSISGLEITLAKGAASVEGIAVDAEGKPLGQSVVALAPDAGKRNQWRLYKNAMADQNGHYSFRNLTPGEYILFAFSPTGGDPAAVQNPEYLKQIEAKGSVVKLGENASESVQLKVVE